MGPYYMTALLSLLGPVKRVCAMATRAGETRTVPSGPSKGQVLPVDVDTHINAILEFVCGAQVTLTCSFDVWDSELPRMELYGTKGTVLINEKDPISGPNLFGGETLMRTPEQYRWADPERRPENVNTPWPVVPHSHPFNSVSHAENPRGIRPYRHGAGPARGSHAPRLRRYGAAFARSHGVHSEKRTRARFLRANYLVCTACPSAVRHGGTLRK